MTVKDSWGKRELAKSQEMVFSWRVQHREVFMVQAIEQISSDDRETHKIIISKDS